MSLPRVLVAAPASSQGKTTLTVGLIAALRAEGEVVAPFKVGPDYIDPGFHGLAAGRAGRNLDAHLCGGQRIGPLLRHGAEHPRPASIAVIEGVMGLFDGKLRSGGAPQAGSPRESAGFGSSAHVARLTATPVILVIDVSHSSGTAAAIVRGLATHDPTIRVAGVLFNRCGSARATEELVRAMADLGADGLHIPVLGTIPRAEELHTPSRHLGLVPAQESHRARAVVEAAGRVVAEYTDLAELRRVAAGAEPLRCAAWDPRAEVTAVRRTPAGAGPAQRPRIAVAAGRAFTFRYPETTELLAAAGCEPVFFDPVADSALPQRIAGLYLGGGFPQVFAEQLSGNAALRAEVRRAVSGGLPTVAECAGLLYLCRSLDGVPMTGVLGASAGMTPGLRLGYRDVVAPADTLLAGAGQIVTAHEFHRTGLQIDQEAGDVAAAWVVQEGRADGVSADPAGTGRPTLHASYQHVHWAGHPQVAQRFADACAGYADRARLGLVREASSEPAAGQDAGSGVDLQHHGDRDIDADLVDLAVNVRRPPPGWLLAAIRADQDLAAYPDPGTARAAIAARHQVPESAALPTAGAAEAFTLIARAFTPRFPTVVYPQFTEPEAALARAGHQVLRVVLPAHSGFGLDPLRIDERCDLVVVGNPTNPTSVLHPAEAVLALRRPGRILVVDEAFMDAVAGERETVLGADLTGLLVIRSLTKTWGLAGLRAGYLVGDPELVTRCAAQQPPWSVSTPAIRALVACLGEDARDEQEQVALVTERNRADLVGRLRDAGFGVVAGGGPFVLVDTSACGAGSLRPALARAGFAVRRGESFPGLGPAWLRVAVRTPQVHRDVVAAMVRACGERRSPGLP
ncbi:MAG: cobyrinic acid a,c-diamide synthase [Micrococcales bacterium]|nr:MAG: cobyrinic acid a,c-diamide synthase [Micrococcales bacterium]